MSRECLAAANLAVIVDRAQLAARGNSGGLFFCLWRIEIWSKLFAGHAGCALDGYHASGRTMFPFMNGLRGNAEFTRKRA